MPQVLFLCDQSDHHFCDVFENGTKTSNNVSGKVESVP
jgi:hypothetical protein